MKTTYLLPLLAAGLLGSLCHGQQPADVQTNLSAPTTQDTKMQWWRDAHFGMFIHYGLYSGLECSFDGKDGRGEWTQRNLNLDTDTYAAAAKPLFRPAPGCAEKWAELAQAAGCRYMVLTSKHHEGFALFDAPNTDFCSAKLLGRDIVKEFADACRARGMRVGFYHSVIDWHQKDYDNGIAQGKMPYPEGQSKMLAEKGIPRNHEAYIRYLHEQVRTLMTRYGKVDILWWDFSNGELSGDRGWKATELLKMCRELQPGIIMNNRLYPGHATRKFSDKADFCTPEQLVPDRTDLPLYDWESCMTVGHHWGYSRFEKPEDYKTPADAIRLLEACVSRGGNLLLNVGPMPDGSIPEPVERVFRRMGDWMAVNGEAIYGSRAVKGVDVPCVRVGENLYIFLPATPGDVCLPGDLIGLCRCSVLGQPDCKVKTFGSAAPETITYRVPESAWEKAVEGLPVLKLEPVR